MRQTSPGSSEPTPSHVPPSRRDPRGRSTPPGPLSVRRRRAPGISGRRWTKRPTRHLTAPGGQSARRAPPSSTAQSRPAAAGRRAIPTCVVSSHRGKSAATRMVTRVARPVAAAGSTPTNQSSRTNPQCPRSHVAGPCRTGHRVPPRHTIPSRRSGTAAQPGLTSRAGSPRRAPGDRASPEPTPGSTTPRRRLDAAPRWADLPG
jgi:hypothetical protein